MMKKLFLIAALTALAAGARAEEAPKGPTRAKALTKIVQSAPRPAASTQADEKAEPPAEVVMMAPFTVVEQVDQRALAARIERQTQKSQDERFSIVKGGALLKKDIGKARVELGAWGAGSGLNLLRISW